MHSTTSPRAIDLSETVRSILAQKSHALWSISPETSVYDAIGIDSPFQRPLVQRQSEKNNEYAEEPTQKDHLSRFPTRGSLRGS